MDIHQLPTPTELQALYELPARIPAHEADIPTRGEVLATWTAIAVFLATFWTAFFLGCRALLAAVTG